MPDAILIAIVSLALLFDFLNGFHDSANSIATVVSTRVLTPRAAVIWAAFFNFIAFLFFGLHVANTMGKGIIESAIVNRAVIASALLAASGWDIITWYYGLPTSSSHALIGGLVGAGLAKSGTAALVWSGIAKTVVFMILAPVLGLAVGFGLAVLVYRLFWHIHPGKVDWLFRRGQLVSAALYSLGHGGNDAQKTMGIIAILLFAGGYLGPTFRVPLWVILACQAAMGLGTLFGGWRIVKTMGQRLAALKPVDGFCAEMSGAMMLFATGALGIPVSTTHTITGAITGVGAIRRLSAVRWGVAGRVVWAWIFTIPASAVMSWLTYHAVKGWVAG